MKFLPIIIAIFYTAQMFGQEASNQKTQEGQKVGKWFVYNENGSVKEVRFYEPYYLLGNYEEFVFDTWDGKTDTVQSADTIEYAETLLWTEKYEYDSQGQLAHVIKYARNEPPLYLFGSGNEIALRQIHFTFNEQISDVAGVTMTIHNRSEQTLKLNPIFEDDNFRTEQNTIVLPPNQEIYFSFQLIIEPQVNHYAVILKNDSISIDLSVRTTGYHLKSEDFYSENILSVHERFVYWRNGNEALLSVYDTERENLLRTFSLAKERTTIVLKGIKPGKYTLCKTDFSLDQQTCCELKIER